MLDYPTPRNFIDLPVEKCSKSFDENTFTAQSVSMLRHESALISSFASPEFNDGSLTCHCDFCSSTDYKIQICHARRDTLEFNSNPAWWVLLLSLCDDEIRALWHQAIKINLSQRTDRLTFSDSTWQTVTCIDSWQILLIFYWPNLNLHSTSTIIISHL